MKRQMMTVLIVLVSMSACAPTPSPATGTISGRVFDAITGEPIAGANVTTDPPTGSVTTDADGSYAIVDILPDEYTVTAMRKGQDGASVQVRVDSGGATPADIHIGTETIPATRIPSPSKLAEVRVTHNADWTPYIEEKNGGLMALVPKGCFIMGSTDEQIDYAMELFGPDAKRVYFSNEQPAHQVCIEQPFWIDVYEVTNEQYGSVDCSDPGRDPSQPRVCASWTEAAAHCEARQARLPSGVEWEYAARGPDALIFPWGNMFIADNLVYAESSGSYAWEVGSKPGGVSWIGAYDLSGNVEEWIADLYEWRGDMSDYGTRGGSWASDIPSDLRAARVSMSRNIGGATYIGFRCALSY